MNYVDLTLCKLHGSNIIYITLTLYNVKEIALS